PPFRAAEQGKRLNFWRGGRREPSTARVAAREGGLVSGRPSCRDRRVHVERRTRSLSAHCVDKSGALVRRQPAGLLAPPRQWEPLPDTGPADKARHAPRTVQPCAEPNRIWN